MTTPALAPLVLIIRDGWGLNPNPEHAPFDAVRVAQSRGLTPNADRLMRDYPWTLIKTCSEDVGLPPDTMGNSEVGHQNIGAGRVVPQESLVMTRACKGGLENIPAIRAAIEHCLALPARNLHLMGIASDAGVHGQLDHLYAMLRACKTLGLAGKRVVIHLFTDGRDTGPYTGKDFIAQVEAQCRTIGVGHIATLCGRYYAMDRDYRWERVKLAFDLLTASHSGAGLGPASAMAASHVPGADVSGGPRFFRDAGSAIQDYYDHPTNPSQQGDEFVTPRMIGEPTPIRDGDSVIFYNYRGDRPREICAAFCFPDDRWANVKPSPDSGTPGFARGKKLNLHFVTMTQYWTELDPFVKVAFPKPPRMKNIAGEYFASLGLRQFRCAETEKYPHVTFFFNDYRDEPFPGESREIIQSPKVATYDLKPEMSAAGVRDAVLRRLDPTLPATQREQLIVVNFANGDMVGHTGKLEAAITACATVDLCVGAIVDATLKLGGAALVFADHGNCEQMWDPETKAPHTSHTLYDVPLIVVSPAHKGAKLRGDRDGRGWFDEQVRERRGRLADVLPTALAIMGMPKPAEMAGQSLLA